ncbi:MAG: UPF0280 family protein [Candidatus Omnitrophota bacterium]
MAYKNRLYRKSLNFNSDLESFGIEYFESNLLICAKTDLKDLAKKWLKIYHQEIADYADKYPEFKTSLRPLSGQPKAPSIIKAMLNACRRANVGPMAGVAGAIAEHVGKQLLAYTDEVIIENGGDIFLSIKKRRTVGIFAGANNICNRLGIILEASKTPYGLCASSGTFGHSLSFGKTDATVVLAKNTVLADCFATAIGNLVACSSDIPKALKFAKKYREILGLIIITKDSLAAYGKIKFNILDTSGNKSSSLNI